MKKTKTDYAMSMREIERRKQAFSTLVLTFALGFILVSIDVMLTIPMISTIGLVVMAFILWGLTSLMNRFFKTYSQTETSISDKEFVRKGKKTNDRISFGEIVKVHLKKTTARTLREISLTLRNGQRLHLDGLQEFEAFKEDLLSRCDEDIVITEHIEKIDYDHPAFYAILGGLLGGVMTPAIRLLLSLPGSALMWLSILFAVYLLGLGIYWLVTRPLSRQYGEKYRKSDLVCGFAIIVVGILVGVYTFIGA